MATACMGTTALSLAVSGATRNASVADAHLYRAVIFSAGAAGGYVLAMTVSFVSGAAFTLFCVGKAASAADANAGRRQLAIWRLVKKIL